MKKIKYFLLINLILVCYFAQAQVKTDFNNEALISNEGRFMKEYEIKIDFEIPAKDINVLLDTEKREQLQSNKTKPFKLAVPVTVDLDIARHANWAYDNETAYGKFTISVNGALSASINFNQFYLPKGTEMYIYNENGKMITGPVTENENNANKIWGSWVYQGGHIIIEIKTPISTKDQLLLRSNNIAYGYKEVYRSLRVGGFGQSEPCNINVICPLGNGWEAERNSVALVLNDVGSEWCSGAMVMNSCNTNRPFFLTADHCFTGQNVSAWRFNFQAWSPTCPHPGINVNGVTYNGSTLRANWTNSDFCLVELNNTPPINSGVNYAGWTRSATPAQNATGIHHPNGDVMKICRDNDPIVRSGGGYYNNTTHWEVRWNQGITAVGSSGSPLFDQNHRIIGQLHGGLSYCSTPAAPDWYGSFDQSYTGGGTNATRLSNWLDPTNTGAVTTNTTNISLLTPAITGPDGICLPATSAAYNIDNLPTCGTNLVTWSTNVSQVTVSPLTGNTTTVSANGYAGLVTLTSTVNGFLPTVATKQIYIGTLPSCSTRTGYWYVNGNQTTMSRCNRLTQIRCTSSSYGPNNPSLCEYYANAWVVDPTSTSIVWSYVSSSGYTGWTANGNQVEVTINTNSPNGWIRLKCTTTNACGSYNWDFWFTHQGSTAKCQVYIDPNCLIISRPTEVITKSEKNIILSPNPTSGQFTVTLNSIDNNANISQVIVVNKMGDPVYTKTFAGNRKTELINMTGMPTDVYTVRIFDGNDWLTKKLSLRK